MWKIIQGQRKIAKQDWNPKLITWFSTIWPSYQVETFIHVIPLSTILLGYGTKKKRHLPRRGRRLIFLKKNFIILGFKTFLGVCLRCSYLACNLHQQWWTQGRGLGAPRAPVIVGPNWGPKSQKRNFFQDWPPLISGSGWLPPHLIWRSGSATGLVMADLKGLYFHRNCGVVSMGEWNRKIWFYQMSW